MISNHLDLTTDTAALARIPVPGAGDPLLATLLEGKPFAALRPMCDALGIAFSSQLQKLRTKSWAVVLMSNTTGSDGKIYEMAMIDRRTLTMWLATIDENRVGEAARAIVRAYQTEAADALDAYFHDGGAINPNATIDQLDQLVGRATAQAKLIAAFHGIIDPKHLEAKARIVLARGLGEAPEITPQDVPLYVSDYLKSRGLASDMIAAKASGFGKRLKGLYVAEHGDPPNKAFQELPNGTVREVFAYTEADRALFDQVWNRHYEGVTRATGSSVA
ncbi:phage antirepressor N-terminal domain-containing protein [Nocardia altamirensis]|uniref:phage antirepressor N-terminal domain-containing protein n=1 Tax=Nocardia altamirensis TaxID=472158 RepID=UPI00084004BA|nr:phage antirepressor N-terminal domain-containing protein [Nocardia altamirensis]